MALLLLGALALVVLMATRPGQTLLAAFQVGTFVLAGGAIVMIILTGPQAKFVLTALAAAAAWVATFLIPARRRRL